MLSIFNKINPKDKFIATFILKGALLYFLWFLLYEKWLLKDGWVDHFLIDHLVSSTSFVLNLIGFTTFQYADAVGVDGTHGVLIGANCNGLSLFALFAGFIIIFPGKIKLKLIYIPIGLALIHIINILRLTGLALIVVFYPDSLDFNHKYTFAIIVYSFVFLMWYIWVKKFALPK
jgi:exosortase family protein XrtF